MKKVIILGHTGFIGKNLLKTIEKEFEVSGYSSRNFNLTNPLDVKRIAEHFDENTTVIMLAAIKREVQESLNAMRHNIQMTYNIAEALQKKRIEKLIYFSSVTVYGEDRNDKNITEKTQINPISSYGISKYTSEKIFSYVCEKNNIPILIFRPSVVFGPGNESEKYRPTGFVRSILETGQITLWGEGEELRDFIYIEDLIKYVKEGIENNVTGIYNLASGNMHSFNEIIGIIKSLSVKFTLNTRERTKPNVDQGFNTTKLNSVFRLYRMEFKEAIKQTYEYVLCHR